MPIELTRRRTVLQCTPLESAEVLVWVRSLLLQVARVTLTGAATGYSV